MKVIFRIIPLLVMAVAMAGIYISCTKDELPNNGEPLIEYIRITDPKFADSLLVGAFQGNLIAIVGENLQGVQQIWFNDQRATVSASYVTNKTILVSVPSTVPLEISNVLKLVFANGKTLEQDFKVAINKPTVASVSTEYALEGAEITIYGDYFYKPLTVTFTGGVEAVVDTITDKSLVVRVPAGAQPGPISVKSNFGTGVSGFWFRDSRNIFGVDDPATNWWHGTELIVASDPNIQPINGKFIRIKQVFATYAYFEFMVGPETSDIGFWTKKIPDEAITTPAKYSLKFEIITLKPFLVGSSFRMYIGNNMGGERNATNYQWLPVLNTKGKWQTVVIPFKDFMKTIVAVPNANGYGVSFIVGGNSVSMDSDFAIDNFRVVPN